MTGLMRWSILPAVALLLVACSDFSGERGSFSEPHETGEESYGLSALWEPPAWEKRSSPMDEAHLAAAAPAEAMPLTPGEMAGAPVQSTAPKRIARSYSFYLSVPSADLAALQKRHLDECARLHCTVLETTIAREIGDRFEGRASIRIAPAAFDRFVKVITAPPAEIIRRSEESEDKSVPILQVEKRLETKIALREHLKAMLAAPGTRTVADLVAVEKELAQVQGDIEAAQAEYDYLRTLTDTVKIFISYSGPVAQVGGVDFSPISYALAGMGDTFVSSVAGLLVFVAATVPWMPVIILLIWLIRLLWRRWRRPGKVT